MSSDELKQFDYGGLKQFDYGGLKKFNYGGLEQFRKPDKVNTTPLLKDLYQHITPQYAADWIVIGTLLGLPTGVLNIIEHDSMYKATRCCNVMLRKWLEMDITASWEKLFTVIDSPAVSCSASSSSSLMSDLSSLKAVGKEVEAVSIISHRIKQINLETRFNIEADTWPPLQPKHFTPLLLVHHNHDTIEKTSAVTKLVHLGHFDLTAEDHKPNEAARSLQDPNADIVTKEVGELLYSLESSNEPQFILIEGAPGIGKSILLKEVAYRWAKGQVLQKFKLVLLLFLRDPAVHQMSSINELFDYFCKGTNMAAEITSACSSYFYQNGGEDMILMFDGFDELPEVLQRHSLIADIVQRKVFPKCGLILSSRSHALGFLRQAATLRVEIFGFAEEERQHFIEQSLQDQPKEVHELVQYLTQHMTIDSLCYVPFNMVVLLFLYKQGIPLPENLTDLYSYFILITICRNLAKHGQQPMANVTHFTELPEPHVAIINQLSKLSLEALGDNKWVFTFDEIKASCPGISNIPGAINGFGLLQAVEYLGLTAKTLTFNFVHFSIQEYLAAYYIARLPQNVQLQILEEKFWNNLYLNTFVFYVGLTKGSCLAIRQFLSGQKRSWIGSVSIGIKKFLSGEHSATSYDFVPISPRFLEDPLKCIYLFRCFYEIGDQQTCKSICAAKFCSDKKVDLSSIKLSAFDVEALALFLVHSSEKYWETLNLWGCQIQDHGLLVLHRGLSNNGIIIKWLQLSANSLSSISLSRIVEIGIECQVKVLRIGHNNLGEGARDLCTILSNSSSTLEILGIESNNLSSRVAVEIFNVLRVNRQLKVLFIYNNKITDDACDVITDMLSVNNVLEELWIGDNPISGEAARIIVQSLSCNFTLAVLRLPMYAKDVIKSIHTIQEKVNEKRKESNCQVKLDVTFL